MSLSRVVVAVVVGVAVLVSGCASDPYPMPASNELHSSIRSPRTLGELVPAVVLYITPRAGDRIDLLGAEPVGVANGAEVTFSLSRPGFKSDGSRVVGEQLEPLEGAVVANETEDDGPEHTVGIVAEMGAREPGRYELSGVRLRYRLNGGREVVRDGIDVVFILCADVVAPTIEECKGS